MSQTVVTATPAEQDQRAERVFTRSMLISATRCLLTYVVFPWILPLVGLHGSVGPAIGLVIGVVAIVSNVFSIRRFWRADHRWKVPVTVLCTGVIGLLGVLVVEDLADLLS